jgi:hypothetical protein
MGLTVLSQMKPFSVVEHFVQVITMDASRDAEFEQMLKSFRSDGRSLFSSSLFVLTGRILITGYLEFKHQITEINT